MQSNKHQIEPEDETKLSLKQVGCDVTTLQHNQLERAAATLVRCGWVE
jgi:hypothetical protein